MEDKKGAEQLFIHAEKVYGDADPSLTYQVSGLKNGDSAGSSENVGVYGINQGDLALNSGNYDLSYHADPSLTYQVSGLKNGDTAGAVLNGGTLPDWAQSLGMVMSLILLAPSWGGMINEALLNVIADAKTKVYGDADPSLTYQVSVRRAMLRRSGG